MHVSKENFPKVKEWVGSVKDPYVIPRLNSVEYEDSHYIGLVFEIKNKEGIYTADDLRKIAESAEYLKDKLSEMLWVFKE